MIKTDLELHEDILTELSFEPRLANTEIATSVNDGVVTLSGTVPSLAQKWLAEDVVTRVRGVKGLAQELTVELPGTHFRKDSDIAKAIQHRMEWDLFLPRDVQIVVSSGVVTLSGFVDWHYQIAEMGKAVRSITGVSELHNLLKLKEQPLPSAEEIKRKIHSSFARAADFDANMVEVRVKPGGVTLNGFVHSWAERDKAAEAAWSLAGIRSVENKIAVLV